jgi:hypothetical protein
MYLLVLFVVLFMLGKLIHRMYEMRLHNDSIYKYSVKNKIISFLGNPMAIQKLISNTLRKFNLAGKASVTLGSLAPEIEVFGLDGVTKYQLIKDFSKAFPNVPLVVCLSSYN